MSLRSVSLTGAPREMGRQFGEELRAEAQAMARTRLDLALQAAQEVSPRLDLDWCLSLAAECVPYLEQYAPAVYQEFVGIAEGAGLTLPQMVIGNGWTDYGDLLRRRGIEEIGGCTSLAVGGDLTAGHRTFVAQTWDMSPTARPYLVMVKRQPQAGPATLSLTTAGCLSLIGLNEAGIAVGNTNLLPTDARPGVHYLAIIHNVLAQSSFESARRAIIEGPRLSGHYYYLAGPGGEFCGIETSATRHQVIEPTLGVYVHTNHYLGKVMLDSGLTTPPKANSRARQQRMEELTGKLHGGVSAETIRSLLSDHGGENPICRHTDDPASWASVAAAVISPEQRRMWARAGNPCQGEMQEYHC